MLDGALLEDTGLLDFLAPRDLGGLDGLLAIDLALADLQFVGDAAFGDGAVVGDTRLLDRFLGNELRLFGLGIALGAFTRQFGALLRPTELDVAFLDQARFLALALDGQRLLLGFEVAGANLDHRILFDVVPELAPLLDVLDQGRQTFGVEAVGRIEIFERSLVDIHDGDRFQFQPVARQILLCGLPDTGDISAALLVHLGHGHLGGDDAQRGFELGCQQAMQVLRFQRAPAERGGGDGNGFARGLHADIEFGLDIDSHAVTGDQRLFLVAHHLQRNGVHVDRRDVVNDRPDECAAVNHHLLAKETGPDESDLLGRTAVQPVHHPVDDEDDDDRQNEPKDQLTDKFPSHFLSSRMRAVPGSSTGRRSNYLPRIFLKRRVCSVSAISVGSLSIEDAP